VRGQPWREGATETSLSIYELLKTDHEQIHNICRNILQEEDPNTEKVWNLFVELKQLLSSHIKAEELVFYNTLHDRSLQAEDDELRFDVMEGFEEHHLAQLLVGEISELHRDTDRWMAKMKLLSDSLERHFAREENDLFESAKRDLGTAEAQRMAEEFLEEKDLIAQEMH
jgi:hemerythrin-like domain-containing protein